MPAGELVTVPLPVPAVAVVSVNVCRLNVAVTEVLAFSVTAQPPAPAQAPLQPWKSDPVAGVAVSVTLVPLTKLCAQALPQLMPVGELVTVPLPAPTLVVVRVNSALNVAVHVLLAFIVTVPDAQPAAPVHPANTACAPGVAVSVTVAPLG